MFHHSTYRYVKSNHDIFCFSNIYTFLKLVIGILFFLFVDCTEDKREEELTRYIPLT